MEHISSITNSLAVGVSGLVAGIEAWRADRALDARDDALHAAWISRTEADTLARTASLAHRRALIAEAEIARLREALMISEATRAELVVHCSSLLEELEDVRGH